MSKCPILHEAWRSRLGASVGPGPHADVTLPCFTARPSEAQQAPLGCQAQGDTKGAATARPADGEAGTQAAH